jgi:peptide ABC transporter permease
MLSEGKPFMQTCYWLLIYPGLIILINVVIFNLLGDSLRDILDPKYEN